MKQGQQKLTGQEKAIIELLKVPYGVEKNLSDIERSFNGVLKNAGLLEVIENLEQRGYLKSRFYKPEGYLVERRYFSLHHTQLHKTSRQRLLERLEADRMFIYPMAA